MYYYVEVIGPLIKTLGCFPGWKLGDSLPLKEDDARSQSCVNRGEI